MSRSTPIRDLREAGKKRFDWINEAYFKESSGYELPWMASQVEVATRDGAIAVGYRRPHPEVDWETVRGTLHIYRSAGHLTFITISRLYNSFTGQQVLTLPPDFSPVPMSTKKELYQGIGVSLDGSTGQQRLLGLSSETHGERLKWFDEYHADQFALHCLSALIWDARKFADSHEEGVDYSQVPLCEQPARPQLSLVPATTE